MKHGICDTGSGARAVLATTLDGFEWEFNAKGVDRRTIEQLATCDFVRRHDNVILADQSGLLGSV